MDLSPLVSWMLSRLGEVYKRDFRIVAWPGVSGLTAGPNPPAFSHRLAISLGLGNAGIAYKLLRGKMSPPRLFFTIVMLAAIASRGLAADPLPLEDATRKAEEAGKFIGSITPVFSQLIRFHYPGSFKGVLQKTTGNYFILQLVPAAETAQIWSQMVTLTGQQGLASAPFITPELIANTISDRFQKSCPANFAMKPLGSLQTGGAQPRDGFALVMSCGSVQDPAGSHSETALIVAIKGTADYYTLQWAERGPSGDQTLDLTDRRWPDRLDQFKPVILCPILPGEPAPYPSCVNQK